MRRPSPKSKLYYRISLPHYVVRVCLDIKTRLYRVEHKGLSDKSWKVASHYARFREAVERAEGIARNEIFIAMNA